MIVNVWNNFTKRKNSTAQPTNGTQVQVVLKEDTSIHNPSFVFNEPMPAYTYIQAFNRYYFVTDVTNLDAHRSIVSCTLDVLATYKSSVLNYTAFVERSASNYDPYIRDPALSVQQNYYFEDSTITDISSVFDPTGMFVATVLSKPYGLILYLTNSLNVYKGILDSGCYPQNNITDWINSGIAAAYDLDVYIGSIKWMPLSLSTHGLNVDVPNGGFAIGPLGILPSHLPTGAVIKSASPSYRVGERIAISLPASNLFNDFRDSDPNFVQYSLSLPGVGVVPIESAFIGSCIHNNRTLYDYIMIDISTGLITHSIETTKDNKSVRYCEFKGSIAVDIPIGKSRSNVIEALTTFIGGKSAAVGGLMGGRNIAGAVGTSLVTGIKTIDAAISPQTSMISGSGNRTDLYVNSQAINLSRKIIGSKSFPTAVAGRPLMQFAQLSSLSGFVQCGNASVPVNARDQERDEINSYLNSGIYIE